MKNILISVFVLYLLQSSLYSQTTYFYSSPPEYIGGFRAMFAFISTNLVVPDSVKLGLAGGSASVQLEIDSLGNVQRSKITRGIKGCAQCDKEALRVISLFPKPAFKPAIDGNVPVRSIYPLQVRFSERTERSDSYDPKKLYGRWLFRNPDYSKCIECAEVFFKPDNSAMLGSDTLSWRLNDKELFISNSSFFNDPVYKVTFSGNYDHLKLEGKRSSYYLSRDW